MLKRVTQTMPAMATILAVAALTGCTIQGSHGGGMSTSGMGGGSSTMKTTTTTSGGTTTKAVSGSSSSGGSMSHSSGGSTTTSGGSSMSSSGGASSGGSTVSSSSTTTTTSSSSGASTMAATAPTWGSSSTVYYPTGHQANAALRVDRMCPAEVTAGSPFEYELKVCNVSPAALENVMVTETIASNFSFTSSQPQAMSTTGGVAQFNLGSLASGECKSVKIMGSAGREGRIASCATVSYTLPICCTINVTAPALKITKSVPSEASLCDTIPVKLVVTNSGTGMAKNVMVKDMLPAGWTTADGKNAVEQSIGNLGGGESRAVDFMVKSGRTGSFSNTASALADGGLKADSNTTTTVVKNCNLAITKKAQIGKHFGQKNAVFTITVANNGDGVAKNVVVSDPIPAGASFVSATDGGNASGGSVVWNCGDMAPGQSKTMSVTMNPGTSAEVRNTATAASVCCPNVSASDVVSYDNLPAIVVELVDEPDPLAVGEETLFTVKVRNQGNKTDTNLRVVFTLANGLTYVTGGGATAVSAAGQTITFGTVPSLAPKQEVVWTVRAKCTAANGDIRSNLNVTTDYFKTPITEIESTNTYQ